MRLSSDGLVSGFEIVLPRLVDLLSGLHRDLRSFTAANLLGRIIDIDATLRYSFSGCLFFSVVERCFTQYKPLSKVSRSYAPVISIGVDISHCLQTLTLWGLKTYFSSLVYLSLIRG